MLGGKKKLICREKECHKVRDFLIVRSQEKGSVQSQSSFPSSYAPKMNRFYALHSRGEQHKSPDVVTRMLQVFYINVYALIDLSAGLSYVTPLVAKKFNNLSDVLVEPFLVTTPVGHSIVSRRVFKSYPIYFPNQITWVDLVEVYMVDLGGFFTIF